MKSKPGRITVIYNSATPSQNLEILLADADTVRTAQEVWWALTQLGWAADVVEVTADKVESVGQLKAHLVFNLCEWTGRKINLSCRVIEALEAAGIPYTGASAQNYFATTDKIAFKKALRALNLPTPAWQVMRTGEEALQLRSFPVIIKPVYEHGSIGVTQEAVVVDEGRLRRQVAWAIAKYQQPVLVEEYIPGREIKITLIGNGDGALVLPLAEVEFGASFDHKWKILTFPSKWLERSVEFRDSNTVCPPLNLAESDSRRLVALAKETFSGLGCRDYVRFDIRLAASGIPYILEVNSNPSLENAPGYAPILSAARHGLNYEQLIGKIVEVAWSRYDDAPVEEKLPVAVFG